MFTKKKNETTNLTSENITTVIAEDCKIEGTIECKAFIKVDGQALGGINSSGGIILGEKGLIKGDVKTNELIVYGRIEGDAYAKNLVIKNTGKISGNIQAEVLQVEKGAYYKGNINMDQQGSSDTENKSSQNNSKEKK